MTSAVPDHSARAPLPRGVVASTVVGGAAGTAAWLLAGAWPSLTTSYGRLDQLTALTLGAVVGGGILGARALRQRGNIIFATIAGVLLGGIPALFGASVNLLLSGFVQPVVFLLERIGVWALAAGLAAAGLHEVVVATGSRADGARRRREGIAIAAAGGAVAGIVFTLPGPSDAWQAIACLWWGAAIGLATGGPELWRADAVVESLPPRHRAPGVLALREWPLYHGDHLDLGEAKLACVPYGVAIYPPAGGLVVNGHHLLESTWTPAVASIQVGRARHRVRVLRASA